MIDTNSKYLDGPTCPPLNPSFLTHSVHGYPYIPTPNTISWVTLERQRLRRLALCGQNDYPFSYNVTRTFKGIHQDKPLACASFPGGQAAWRLATGNVLYQPHLHPQRSMSPPPGLRLPSICDASGACGPVVCENVTPRKSANNLKVPPANSLTAPVNPETWRTNFYVPFSTLEPRSYAPPASDNPPMSPKRKRNDVPPVDLVSWQSFSLQRANQKPRQMPLSARVPAK